MSSPTATWFYNVGDQRKGPFTPDQIGALLIAGVVNEHTKVWSEAVAEWTPLFRTELRALLGERAVQPPEPEPAPTAPRQAAAASFTAAATQPLDNNKGLAKVVSFALWANCGVSGFVVTRLFGQKTPQAQFNFLTMIESGPMTLVLVVILLATAALFLSWKYRATANLVRIAGPQSVTPGGAVYWYFVPVLWFWKPFEAMGNLWRGFKVPDDAGTWLGMWWLLWWGGFAVEVIAVSIVGDSVTPENFYPYRTWAYITNLVYLLSALAAQEIVKRIAQAEANAVQSFQAT